MSDTTEKTPEVVLVHERLIYMTVQFKSYSGIQRMNYYIDRLVTTMYRGKPTTKILFGSLNGSDFEMDVGTFLEKVMQFLNVYGMKAITRRLELYELQKFKTYLEYTEHQKCMANDHYHTDDVTFSDSYMIKQLFLGGQY